MPADARTLLAEAQFLHQLAVDLCAVEDLESVAGTGADTLAQALGRRGLLVQLWDERSENGVVAAARGPELSERMLREPIQDGEVDAGEVVVDEGGGVDLDTRRLVARVAISVSVAAARVRRQRERDAAQHATVLALATLAERRDNETGRHLRRVARFCRVLAERMREEGVCPEEIDDDWIEDLVRSSPLHDIGKVAIPDSVLLKPGRLSPAEWELMKTHTTIGAETIDDVMRQTPDPGFLAMGRDIALCHHERWDGGGYPRGIEREEIPLCARILALADVYDALTSERPYKHAWSHAEAVACIRDEAGKHFDARVVRAFLARLDAFDHVRRELSDAPVEARSSGRVISRSA